MAIFWCVFVAAATIRVWQSFFVGAPDIGDCVSKPVQGVGHITEEPSRTATGQVLVVSESSMSAAGDCGSGLLIRIKTKVYPAFSYDDHVSFTGKLLKPMNFQSGDDGRTFDYQGYLAKDDIYYEMKSAVVARIDPVVTDDAHTGLMASVGQKIVSALFRIKHSFVDVLDRTLGEPQAALAAGLVVGEKASLGKDLINDFRTVGLIHIVVLSGFNITIVADAIRRMLSRLPRLWGIAIGGIGIALFGVLVGGGATVIRSCFMAGVALSADVIRRDYNVVRALMLAGLLMIIQSPMILLHDVSFQLSFLATMGLILLASPIEMRLGFITETFGLRGIVASTFATQIFVSPFILYTMGQISIIGVVVNILVLPFIPVTMLAVFLTGAVGMVYLPIAQVIAWAAHLLLSYELFLVTHFARLPFAAAHVDTFSVWWVVGFYAVFGIGYVVTSRIQRK